MELISNIQSLSKIENFIDEVCVKHAVDEDCYGNMLIAVTEAVNNAIVHGNKYDNAKKVNLSFESTEKHLMFVVSDEGQGFDIQSVPDPTLPENINKLNGRGVFLMKSLSDDVEFTNNGTEVKLKFSITSN